MTDNIKHFFSISTSSGVPIYRQVIDQVNTLIATGRLKEGEFMPSVRKVSKDLEVNPMTVSKAYSLLEKDGVLEFVRGKGMKVGKPKTAIKDMADRTKEIVPIIKEVVSKARQLGLGKKTALDVFIRIWEEK